jgi:hypothetical protein
MTWNDDDALSTLRDVLAGLYSTVEDARRVVQDAGLDPKYILLEGKAANFWGHILDEAQKNRQVQAIVAVARKQYPRNEELARAEDKYLQWVEAGSKEPVAASVSRGLAPAGLQELEAESARRIRSRPEEHVPQDPDIHIAQELHWDRESLVRTFIDMIRKAEVEKEKDWRVLAIQGSEDAHVRALVTRFEEICKQVTTSLPLLVARVSLEQDSPHRLAHAILSDLYMTADRSKQPVICNLAEPLLETCAKIEHGLPGRRMTGVLPMSEAQVARELTKCLEPITQDCTVVLLLEDFEKIEDETGRWLRDQWLVSSARDELGVVIVITGESGLGKLVNFAHYGILCHERLPIIKWEDFRDWARRGYHLSEQDVPDETLRKMYDDLKESTKDLVKYLKFKKMEIS